MDGEWDTLLRNQLEAYCQNLDLMWKTLDLSGGGGHRKQDRH